MLRKASALLALVLVCGVGQAGESKADGPPFIAHLPQGTVELVGVTSSYRPTKQSRWWQPDGSAAPIGPFCAQQKYPPKRLFADEKVRTFLVRFENLPADASTDPVGGVNFSTTPQGRCHHWVAGAGTSARNPEQFFTGAPLWDAGTHLWAATDVYDVVDADGELTLNNACPPQPAATDRADTYAQHIVPYYYKMFAEIFTGSARTTDLRVGVSMGAWETVVSRKPDSAGTSSFTRDGREWTVTFRKATTLHKAAAGDATQVTITSSSYTYGQWKKRLVAVTSDGSERTTSIGNMSGGDHGVAFFHNLPLSSIKELRLQVRPYCCVEFDNVSLQPGLKTHVKVVSSDDSGNTKK
jgi:hypothetical protein